MKNEEVPKDGKQNKVHEFLSEWKKKKAIEEKEAIKNYQSPEYQRMLDELRKENAAKGIIITK